MEEKTYYWNSVNRLGSGEKAIKRGDILPASYAVDSRLVGWLEAGTVSLSEPSKAAENLDKLDKLELDNLSLRSKIERLTDQLAQSAKVSEKNSLLEGQNKGLNKRIDALTREAMENEAKFSTRVSDEREKSKKKIADYKTVIAEMRKLFKEPTISKNEKAEMLEMLEGL